MNKSHFSAAIAAMLLAGFNPSPTQHHMTDSLERDDTAHLDRATRRRILREQRKAAKRKNR